MHTHGGERTGAGRPLVPIDEKRMMSRIEQGVSQRQIARDLGVAQHVIWYRALKLKKG